MIRINENKTIVAMATTNGKLIVSLYDSGFRSIKDVINSLNSRMIRECDNVEYYISIQDEDKRGWYNKHGRKIL